MNARNSFSVYESRPGYPMRFVGSAPTRADAQKLIEALEKYRIAAMGEVSLHIIRDGDPDDPSSVLETALSRVEASCSLVVSYAELVVRESNLAGWENLPGLPDSIAQLERALHQLADARERVSQAEQGRQTESVALGTELNDAAAAEAEAEGRGLWGAC